MNIKIDIDHFLERSGWTPYRLAQESGVNINVIRRIQRGLRKNVQLKTLEKLSPFLYPNGLFFKTCSEVTQQFTFNSSSEPVCDSTKEKNIINS